MAFAFNQYNPIREVDGAYVLVPSKYEYDLQDISNSKAGRTEDEIMHKNRTAQKVVLSLEWQTVSITDAATLLQIFNPEYVNITYLDCMAGAYRTKRFYIGDRHAPIFNAKTGLWDSISFNAIEQ